MMKTKLYLQGENSMIVKEYVKRFEKLGFGMFVHFGLYSVHGKGEWAYNRNITPAEY
jgi:alpha-L-fucosidase